MTQGSQAASSGRRKTNSSRNKSCFSTHKLSKRGIKKTIPFKIALIIIKYLGINLIKEVKDLYFENCILK